MFITNKLMKIYKTIVTATKTIITSTGDLIKRIKCRKPNYILCKIILYLFIR